MEIQSNYLEKFTPQKKRGGIKTKRQYLYEEIKTATGTNLSYLSFMGKFKNFADFEIQNLLDESKNINDRLPDYPTRRAKRFWFLFRGERERINSLLKK